MTSSPSTNEVSPSSATASCRRARTWCPGSGALLGVGGFIDDALPYIDQADEIGDQLDDERVTGWNGWTRTVALYSNTRLFDAIEAGERATERLRRSGDVWMLCDSLSWTALALNLTGSIGRGRDVGTEALELSRRLGHAGGEILSHRAVLAAEVLTAPNLESWEEGVRRDIDLCRSIDSPWMSQGNAWLGVILQQQGRLDEAREQFDVAKSIEPISAYGGLAEAYALLNHAYARDRDGFLAAFEAARPRLPGGATVTPWGTLLVATCAVQGAAFFDLPQIAAEVDGYLTTNSTDVVVGFFDGALRSRLHAMAAALAQRWDEAEELFTVAHQQSAEFPNELDRPKVAHWHGKMLLDRGRPEDRQRAHEMIADALESYRSHGMPVLATMAEELLALADR